MDNINSSNSYNNEYSPEKVNNALEYIRKGVREGDIVVNIPDDMRKKYMELTNDNSKNNGFIENPFTLTSTLTGCITACMLSAMIGNSIFMNLLAFLLGWYYVIYKVIQACLPFIR